jgi:hypothetical protein
VCRSSVPIDNSHYFINLNKQFMEQNYIADLDSTV